MDRDAFGAQLGGQEIRLGGISDPDKRLQMIGAVIISIASLHGSIIASPHRRRDEHAPGEGTLT